MDPGVLVIIAVAAGVVGTVLSWSGWVEGPLVVALCYAGLGALLVLNGGGPVGQVFGALYLAGSAGEFCAAWAYWTARGRPNGPSDGWKLVATLIGAAGLLGFALLILYSYLAFMAWMSTWS